MREFTESKPELRAKLLQNMSADLATNLGSELGLVVRLSG
jgi:hypothetical protein